MKDKTVVQITSALEMLGFIKSNGTQCRFVSLISETPVTKIKAASPYKGVLKVSRKLGMVNVNYSNAVAKRIAEKLGVPANEVEYEAGETWYRHLETVNEKALPIVVNKKETVVTANTEHYLQYYPTSSENAYVMPDGTPVSETDLKPWLYKESERADYKPTVIVIKLSNIKRLAASGVIMEAEDVEEAEASLASVS